ncbi:hypothetical protein [Hymenobacter sp. YC55]|uniref:hypothetical protein n=1 Tax=Hymenobacter sp. YC55 TaxID=3034019 RepID=UPI0023F9E149|nr:hypothetical protein [Hymenobacter sp. YC55]MDF7815312.1 hypothetical protein [Hymenobacter sp. YC55]
MAERIAGRLRKPRVPEAQIETVLEFLGEDSEKQAKFMKVTHRILQDYEAGSKSFDNVAGTAINIIKSEFFRIFEK